MSQRITLIGLCALAWTGIGAPAVAQNAARTSEAAAEAEAAKLAKQLSNPVADLISVPFQGNYNSGGGYAEKGDQYYVNIQPVIPIHLNENWNVISRTILPFITQTNITPPPGTGQTGFGDTTQSFFLSPRAGGLIWGIGPALLIPTGTSKALSTGQWAAGPTAVALVQTHGWTVGTLMNQLWSFAGNDARSDVNQLYVQPFITYTTKHFTTYGINSETTCNWQLSGKQCAVPVNVFVAQLLKVGGMPMQFQLGGRYYFTGPYGTPDWGLRFTVTFLYPTNRK
jgi:hypothetical protein